MISFYDKAKISVIITALVEDKLKNPGIDRCKQEAVLNGSSETLRQKWPTSYRQ